MEGVTRVCVCLGAGCEVLGVSGLGLGFTNSEGTWGKWEVSVFWLRLCGWCWGRVVGA